MMDQEKSGLRRLPALPLFILLLLHLWTGWTLLPALAWPAPAQAGVAAVLLLSLWLIPRSLLNRQPGWQVWAGLIAAGWFSTLFVLNLLREIARLALHLAQALTPALDSNLARATLALSLLATLIGFINARRIARVKKVTVRIAGLPPALAGFTIAQVSDLHVGPTIRRNYVQGVVQKVNRLQPDLIALTGDLVDGSVAQLAEHTLPLSDLQSRHGSFFVTGNHEYYSHAPSWIAEFRRLGMQVLLNEHVVIRHRGEDLVVGGITDWSAHNFVPGHRSDPQRALAGAPQEVVVKLLLAHQPRSAMAAAEAGFTLQLSGHTHGGQFFPWNFFVPLQQPFVAGLARVKDLWVYTSRGTGYWGPPKRLFAPSEITQLTLLPQ